MLKKSVWVRMWKILNIYRVKKVYTVDRNMVDGTDRNTEAVKIQ